MKIMHLAPLWFPVDRDSPGGIETYLPMLLRALEDLGCENTLLASGDSHSPAHLITCVERNIWDGMAAGQVWEYQPYEVHQVMRAIELADGFQVIHSHLGYGGHVLSALAHLGQRVLHTQHNSVTQDLEWFVSRHPDLPCTTVSEAQAVKLRAAGATNCQAIPNGIDFSQFPFRAAGGHGLVFLGRMEEEKGPDLAVQVAQELELELKLAGPMSDQDFFDRALRPALNDRIRYLGAVGHAQKTELLGQADCVLVPSRWEEPFGLVAIESMACGTPVVALGRGALPEVIESGVTGLVAEHEDDLVTRVRQAPALDRAAVRAAAAARFDIRHVARSYLDLYETVAARGTGADAARRG